MIKIDEKNVWALPRIVMGWLMFWPFIDKVFGLGYNTCADAKTGVITYMCKAAWIKGGSPTFGYLKFGVHGPFAPILHAMAGSHIVEWLFMLGLLGIGLALLVGAAVKPASFFGIIMVLLMSVGGYDFTHDPILDVHFLYAVIFFGLFFSHAGQYCGIGKWWTNTSLVKKYPILE